MNNFFDSTQLKRTVVTHKKNNSPRPVKLPYRDIVSEEVVVIPGWGTTHRKRNPFMLLYLNMTVLDRDSCQVYSSKRAHLVDTVLHESEFCTFYKSNKGYGACGVSFSFYYGAIGNSFDCLHFYAYIFKRATQVDHWCPTMDF